jgi:hypothetical protein
MDFKFRRNTYCLFKINYSEKKTFFFLLNKQMKLYIIIYFYIFKPETLNNRFEKRVKISETSISVQFQNENTLTKLENKNSTAKLGNIKKCFSQGELNESTLIPGCLDFEDEINIKSIKSNLQRSNAFCKQHNLPTKATKKVQFLTNVQ